MQISAKGIKIATRHFDICRDIDLACPVPAGEQVVAKFKFPVPFYAITMSADVVITAVSSDGEGLICLEAPGVPVVGWNGAQGEGQKGMDSDSDGVAPSSPSLRRPQMAHIGDVEMIRHVFLAL